MQKSMGWKVNGTALKNFGWIGNVNVQYLLDPDHNQSLRLKWKELGICNMVIFIVMMLS